MIQQLPIEEFRLINRKLKDNYGNTNDLAHFRLVWSDDETQLRSTNFTVEGLQLMYPEVRLMRKYPDIHERYVLEWLQVNLNFDKLEDGKPVEELVYGPCWTFEVLNDRKEKCFIAPNYGACKFVAEIIMNNVSQAGNYTKYEDPDINSDIAKELKEERIKELQKDLFGDESSITDALSLRQGVAYGPGSSPNSSTPHKGR